MPNRLLIPNTCQVPNVIFDQVMPKVSHATFKVLMAIVRKTYGWNKVSDHISIKQITDMTGVKKTGVLASIKALDSILSKVIKIEAQLDKMAMFLSGQVETRPATKEETAELPF